MNKFDGFKEVLFKKPFAKRMILMLVGVIVMGICVSILRLTRFGTDPFSAFCYGMSDITGISFGTCELVFNSALLIFVFSFDIKRLGFGTIGNTVIVGYMADITSYILKKLGITYLESFYVRVIVLIVVLTIFIIAVSLYINAGMGASAYDVLPYMIHNWICKISKKDISFKIVRMGFDAFFTIVAFAIHGQAGVMTVIIVFTLGPMIEAVARLLSKVLNINE